MTWLVAALLLLSPENGRFTNVASELGLAGQSSGRAVFVDLDGDGALDVVLDRQHFFFQREGRFAAAPALPEVYDLVLFADFDNDGDQDCFAGAYCEVGKQGWKDHGRSNTLFLNDGKGNWRARELDMPRTSVHGACALDYDRDGKLDLFVGSGYRIYGASLDSFADRLYRGNGVGGFEDVTDRAALLTGATAGVGQWSKPTYGVTHGDFDGDGWQDLWVCTYGRQWNHLWLSDKGKRFKNIAPDVGFDGDADRSGKYSQAVKDFFKKRYGSERADEPPFRANGNTFDCAIADFDNDGDMDCILAEITHSWGGPSSDLTSLLINEDGRFDRHPEVFRRPRGAGGWNQGDIHCGWIDFDNDGLLDALIASSDYPDRQELKLYRQKPDHTFEEAWTGFDWEGAAQISVGDYDNDGDLDILCGRSLNRLPKERRQALGKSCALFRNEVGNANHWLQVEVRGARGVNRDGIGCRIRVTTPDGVTQTREIRGGHGHVGHNNPYIAHFGLGKNETATVEIRHADRKGTTTTLRDVRADQRLLSPGIR